MRRGKREMRKNYTPFLAGMATMVLLIGLISASFAANGGSKDQSSEGAQPAQIGVGIFLKQQIAPGEALTTEKGSMAPKVLSCADSKGETYYCIEAAAAAELFDVTDGVTFHEEANQLEFGYRPFGKEKKRDVFYSPERYDFSMGGTLNPDGSRLNTVGNGRESFTGIYLPAGAKITRAFRIDENKPLENQLQVQAKPLGPGGVNVRLTAEQYRSGQ